MLVQQAVFEFVGTSTDITADIPENPVPVGACTSLRPGTFAIAALPASSTNETFPSLNSSAD